MSRLTAKQVEHIQPHPTRRRELPAGHGLFLVVQPRPSGARSWCVRYRHGGRTRKLTLGKAVTARPGETPGDGVLTLAAAREAAAAALRKLELGVDPASVKPKPEAPPESFAAIARACLAGEIRKGKRSMARQLADMERLVFPTIGAMPMADVRRGHIMRLIDRIDEKQGTATARNVYSSIRKVARWHAVRDETYTIPLVAGLRLDKSKSRDRILSDSELKLVWAAAEETAGMIGPFVQFLFLSSARRGEAAGMRHSEIVAGIWTCPEERSKTKVAIERPLSKLAQDVLTRVPVIAPGDLYFTVNGISPFADFDRSKTAIQAASGTTGWTLHDLRRTSRSLLARAGVDVDTAERCLAHTIQGVRAIYDRHRYIEEMRLAYEKLSALILHIVNPQETVVPLRA